MPQLDNLVYFSDKVLTLARLFDSVCAICCLNFGHFMDNETFELSGLDQKEFGIYKTLLSLKRATVLELSKASAERRTNLYRMLESLISKRLISEIYEGKKHYFIAESPKVLMELVNRDKRQVQEIMPELESIEKEALERPKIKFYEGKQGVATLYDELIAEKSELLAFSWPDRLMNAIDFHDETLVKKRLKYKIPARVIYPDTRAARNRNTGLKESRFSKKIEPFDATLLMAGNKIVMFSHKRWITGVLIENKEMAECLKALFDGYWGELKPRKK